MAPMARARSWENTLQVPNSRSHEVQVESTFFLPQVISDGKGNMPSFTRTLDKGKIAGLVPIIRPVGEPGSLGSAVSSEEKQATVKGRAVIRIDPTREQRDWAVFGGGPETAHYSALTQINRKNVKQLGLAWSFDTGETGGMQSSPLIVGGVLFGITP
jgi:glucose dehydrogenase